MRGGEFENCATDPQEFFLGYDSSNPGSLITNNGTMIMQSFFPVLFGATFNNYGTLQVPTQLGVSSSALMNNFGTIEAQRIRINPTGVVNNHSIINLTDWPLVSDDGEMYNHQGAEHNMLELLSLIHI